MEISQAFSRMFRHAVKSGDFATLRQELGYPKYYATSIVHRFSGRISIHAEVMKRCRIMK